MERNSDNDLEVSVSIDSPSNKNFTSDIHLVETESYLLDDKYVSLFTTRDSDTFRTSLSGSNATVFFNLRQDETEDYITYVFDTEVTDSETE